MPAEYIASMETTVPVLRSVQQIQSLVAKFGASEFSTQYDPATGEPIAIAFKVTDPNLGDGTFLPVALRAPTDVVYKAILRTKKRTQDKAVQKSAREQAARVAWRNLHDFVRASLIGVQTGIMSLGEAFMASLVVTLPTGEAKRLGEIAAEGGLLQPTTHGRLLLGSGGGNA